MVELLLYGLLILLVFISFFIQNKKLNLFLISIYNIFLLYLINLDNNKVFAFLFFIFNIIFFISVFLKHYILISFKLIIYTVVLFIILFLSFLTDYKAQSVLEFKNSLIILSILIASFIFSLIIKNYARDNKK